MFSISSCNVFFPFNKHHRLLFCRARIYSMSTTRFVFKETELDGELLVAEEDNEKKVSEDNIGLYQTQRIKLASESIRQKLESFLDIPVPPQETSDDIRQRIISIHNDPELESILSDLSNLEQAPRIFDLYARLLETTEQASENLYHIYRNAVVSGRKDQKYIFETMLKKAKQLLEEVHKEVRLPYDSDHMKQILEKLEKKFLNNNRDMRLTQDLVFLLSQDKKNSEAYLLEIEKLPNVESFGPISNDDFYSLPDNIKQSIPAIILKQFGKKALKEFQTNFSIPEISPGGELYYVTYDDECLACIGVSQLNGSDFIYDIDWFAANPDAPIKGLTPAIVNSFLRQIDNSREKEMRNFYCACKPYVKSLQWSVEYGYVASGITDPSEHYDHVYFRCRKLENEQGKYASKLLTSDEIESVYKEHAKVTHGKNNVMSDTKLNDGTEVKVCTVSFSGLEPQDKVDEKHPQGWLYQQMKDLSPDFVLTRYVEWKRVGKDQEYICIFEKNKLPTTDQVQYDQAIAHYVEKMKIVA